MMFRSCCWVVTVLALGCGSTNGSRPRGPAGDGGADGGTSGSSPSAGAAGDANSGGGTSNGGVGGTEAGGTASGATGGAQVAGSGGTDSGAGGTDSGGTSAGEGGTSAGEGGSSAGEGGSSAGEGGSSAGGGGDSAGGSHAAGTNAGTGGATGGAGGTTGTGGTAGGVGGIGGGPAECTGTDEQVQACGLNGNGTSRRTCSAGSWGAWSACSDPDGCLNGTNEKATCGLNGNGSSTRVCAAGSWNAWSACSDPDDCLNGTNEKASCGLNGNGSSTRVCAAGSWNAWSACSDPDDCINGTNEKASCGLNGNGSSTRVCAAGSWNPWSACLDPDDCKNGTIEPKPCGLNGQGAQKRSCSMGQWGQYGACVDPDVCVSGSQELGPCGLNQRGQRERSCSAGAWGGWGTCVDPDECKDDSIEQLSCGTSSGTRTRVCELGAWEAFGECSTCVDADADDFGVDCDAGPDCDDANANVNPDAPEVSFDTVDNDCDAATGYDVQYEASVGNPGYDFVALKGSRLFASQGARLFELAADDVAAGPVARLILGGDISQLQVVGDLLYVGVDGLGIQRFDISGVLGYRDSFSFEATNPGFAIDGQHLLLCSVAGDFYQAQRATIEASGVVAYGSAVSTWTSGTSSGQRCEAALVGNKAAFGGAAAYVRLNPSFTNPGLSPQLSRFDVAALPLTGIPGGWVFAQGPSHLLQREDAATSNTSLYFNGPVQGAVHVEDDRIYLGRNTAAASCVSVANAAAGNITASVTSCFGIGASISDIDVDGTRVAVAHAKGLTMLARSGLSLNKGSETPAAESIGPALLLDIDDDLLLWATDLDGIHFYRVGAADGVPTKVSHLPYDGILMGHHIENGILYLVGHGGPSNNGEVLTVDLHSGPTPVELGRTSFGPWNSAPTHAAIVRAADRVAVAWAGTWYYFDVADLATPTEFATAAAGWVHGLGYYAGEVLASASDTWELQRYDGSSLSTPTLLGTLPVDGRHFDIQGDLLLTDDGDLLDLATQQTLLENNLGNGRQSSLDETVGWASDQTGLFYLRLANLADVTRTPMPSWRFATEGSVSYDDHLYVIYRNELAVYSGVNALR